MDTIINDSEDSRRTEFPGSPRKRFIYESDGSEETVYRHKLGNKSTLTAGFLDSTFFGCETPPSLQRSNSPQNSIREQNDRNPKTAHFAEGQKIQERFSYPVLDNSSCVCQCSNSRFNAFSSWNVWRNSGLADPFLFSRAPKFFNNLVKKHHYYINIFGHTIYMGWF